MSLPDLMLILGRIHTHVLGLAPKKSGFVNLKQCFKAFVSIAGNPSSAGRDTKALWNIVAFHVQLRQQLQREQIIQIGLAGKDGEPFLAEVLYGIKLKKLANAKNVEAKIICRDII